MFQWCLIFLHCRILIMGVLSLLDVASKTLPFPLISYSSVLPCALVIQVSNLSLSGDYSPRICLKSTLCDTTPTSPRLTAAVGPACTHTSIACVSILLFGCLWLHKSSLSLGMCSDSSAWSFFLWLLDTPYTKHFLFFSVGSVCLRSSDRISHRAAKGSVTC